MVFQNFVLLGIIFPYLLHKEKSAWSILEAMQYINKTVHSKKRNKKLKKKILTSFLEKYVLQVLEFALK